MFTLFKKKNHSFIQLALLLRGCRSNDDVVFRSFLTVLLLPLKYSLFLRVKSFKVQTDFFLFFAEWLAETLPVIIFKGGEKSSSGVCRNNLWKKDTCKWSVLSLESVKQLWNSLCRFPDIIFRTVGPQSDFFQRNSQKFTTAELPVCRDV